MFTQVRILQFPRFLSPEITVLHCELTTLGEVAENLEKLRLESAKASAVELYNAELAGGNLVQGDTLSLLSGVQLKSLCKSRKLKRYSTLSKALLVEFLSQPPPSLNSELPDSSGVLPDSSMVQL